MATNTSKLTKRDIEYLIAVYKLGGRHGAVGPTRVAHDLRITKVSCREKLQQLAAKGMGEYIAGRGIILSERGIKMAKKSIMRHRMVEVLLHKTLNLGPEDACKEAACIDFYISDAVLEKIATLFKPTRCPCGHEIDRAWRE